MRRSADQLRRDALAIWQAGVDAVRSDRLVCENIRVDGDWLVIGDDTLELSSIGRIAVVGVFSHEIAETKVAQVMELARRQQHPLQCTMEKE